MQSNVKPFLTARWEHLAMINFQIDPVLLAKHVPAGTELDFFDGQCFVSMVGFWFLNTRVKGVAIPFHQNFVEVNLRFYVRRKSEDGWKRGVVFIKEIVPRFAIAFVARTFYGENYVSMPADGKVSTDAKEAAAEYRWKSRSGWNHLSVNCPGRPEEAAPGSEEEFITEHYWGYAKQRDGGTKEYEVSHPRWRIWKAETNEFVCDIRDIYGDAFVDCLAAKPSSAFLADGSVVSVFDGVRLQS